jgi:hypothetical protein
MISRCLALFMMASLLAGCCASGVGCNAPATGGPVAWDGLGVPPSENAAADSELRGSNPGKRKKVGQIDTQADSNPQGGDKYQQEQAADEAADAKLNEQLKICRKC